MGWYLVLAVCGVLALVALGALVFFFAWGIAGCMGDD